MNASLPQDLSVDFWSVRSTVTKRRTTMQNLAGEKSATVVCQGELLAAGITPVPRPLGRGEVATAIRGELRGFTFERLWYYWVVEGPMPLAAAIDMFKSGCSGRTEVRADGISGGVDPVERAVWVDRFGRVVIVDPDGTQRARFSRFWTASQTNGNEHREWVFVKSLADLPDARQVVCAYHVDTPAGLKLIADTIRSLQGAGEEPATTEGFGASMQAKAPAGEWR